MEENRNTTAAASETAIGSIKKLMDVIGNDDELKQKLEDTLAALAGKTSANEEDASEPAKKIQPESEVIPAETGEEDAEYDDDDDTSSDSNFSDIFSEDALAGIAVGFVAGAAVVGGGVLIHKMITND